MLDDATARDDASPTRAIIQQLLRGDAPDQLAYDEYGSWAAVVRGLHEAAQRGGAQEAKRIFSAFVRAHRPLAVLMAGDVSQPGSDPTRLPLVPPLPSEALAVYERAAPCAQWLDDYLAYAQLAFPMTPRSFHEAAGLFIASLVNARRACLHAATSRIFPNLYLLYIAPSGARRKTTALGGVAELLAAADLLHLLLPQRMTPEALIERMSVGRVKTFPSEARQAQWLKEQAFAGQRGWVRDEVSALFGSMKRDYNAELLELLLELYDCKERAGESATVSRGDDVIERSYLAFFGAANPDTLAPHLANRSHWHNGLWARFALLAPGPDEPPVWQFYREPMAIPTQIVAGVQRMARLFPEPRAELQEANHEGGLPSLTLSNVQPPVSVRITPGAWKAWEAYSKATSWTLTQPNLPMELPPELHASYNRLGTHLIKVALLLAQMDAATPRDLLIDDPYIARAQEIVERWRGCLHALWHEQAGTDEGKLMTRMLRVLEQTKATGATCRDLCYRLRVSAREISDALDVLQRAGRVMRTDGVAANGRRIELWSLYDRTTA